MILPTKGIAERRALLTVGADVLTCLETPSTVSGLWDRFRDSSRTHESTPQNITYDWFTLALAYLYAIDTVSIDPSGRLQRADVS
jgi:hypothetical protein